MSSIATSALIMIALFALLLLVRRDMAPRVVLSLSVLLLLQAVGESGNIKPLATAASQLMMIAPVMIAVLLQQELRRLLARPFLVDRHAAARAEAKSLSDCIVETLLPVLTEFSLKQTGALLVLTGQQPLSPHLQFGTALDARLSGDLLQSLFQTSSPLHDGAVILSGSTVSQAACVLPLSDNPDISKRFGTRHRAALGLSELTDAVVLVVSEETGKISGVVDGHLRYDLSPGDLAKLVELACQRHQNRSNHR